jgi:uncharacterized membrane protein YcaP (DUF421 family)
VLQPETPLLEIVARVAIVYGALIVLLRLVGRREVGQLTPLDLLAMLLLSETVSPALTADDDSLPAVLTAATTLVVLVALVGRLGFRSRRVERWMEGEPVPLIEHGRVNRHACDKHRVTDQELASAVRKQGVATIEEVGLAMLEPDGTISVIPESAH